MSSVGRPAFLGDVSPQEAFRVLSEDPQAILVDVRTDAELAFVGGPDLGGVGKSVHHIEWRAFPGGVENPEFLKQMTQLVAETGGDTILFLCRSGARSLNAAKAVEQGLPADRNLRLFNVAEGFEGDLDADGRRGRLSGWKVRGLPWRQS